MVVEEEELHEVEEEQEEEFDPSGETKLSTHQGGWHFYLRHEDQARTTAAGTSV